MTASMTLQLTSMGPLGLSDKKKQPAPRERALDSLR